MYVYKQGAIGEAIHAKIEAAKQSVRGGKTQSVSFLDTLKNYISEDDPVKPVGMGGKANGSAVLYAMQNSGTDTTAAAVLSTLGYKQYGKSENSLKTAADKLSKSTVNLKTALESGSDETVIIALSQLVEDYNQLNTRLGASGSTPGYLYRTALGGYASDDALSGSGISKAADGTLMLSGEKADKEKLLPLLNGIASVSGNIAAYAGSIAASDSGNSGLDSYNALGGYYAAMMDLMQ